MNIYIGADYHGLERKSELLDFLTQMCYNVTDKGSYEYVEGSDFNDPAIAVSKEVREDRGSFGILICDSAHGMTIQANRFTGIRAAHCSTEESAKLAREHDDANILCLSARFTDKELAQSIAKTFLDTSFTGLERRVRRINRLDQEVENA